MAKATADKAMNSWLPETWVDIYWLVLDRPEYFATCQVKEINHVLGEGHDPSEFGVVRSEE